MRKRPGDILFFSLSALIALSANCIAGSTEPAEKNSAVLKNAKVIKAVQIAPGVFDLPIIVPKSLESRKEEFRDDFIKAEKRLRVFAEKHGWARFTQTPIVKQVEIYDLKSEWDKRARELDPTVPEELPKSFSANIEKDILFCVSPELYFANYPQGKDEKDAYVKLMTHELAHRLQIRILNGDEDKMGPIWFFEGFAIYAADQLNHNKPGLTEAQIWSIADAKERGDYRKYNVVFRHFLRGLSLPDYVQKAGDPNFLEWLKSHALK